VSGVRRQASGLRNEAGINWIKGERQKIIMESFKIT